MYLGYFIVSSLLSLLITPFVYYAMYKVGAVDSPQGEKRKIHKKKIPLGGGLAIFLSFFIIVWIVFFGSEELGSYVGFRHILGLFLAGSVLMFGGFLDDKWRLSPSKQLFFSIIAALLIIVFGIGPHSFSNPFGGSFDLSGLQINVGNLGRLVVFADLLVFAWLMGMMFTTKFLDGLDGLVTGLVMIGSLFIFFLSLQDQWRQPEVALLSIIFAGACLGFLVWNWHPAKIFLGEGGSLFTGLALAVLAIISEGKIATTLLVMGLPVLDVLRVIVRRMQKKRSIFHGDDEHLHFKLLASGLKQHQAVLLMYAISLSFGLSAFFLQSTQKVLALLLLLLLMILLGVWFDRREKALL
ncbi:MAG: undecaprenyl/decaprenyl-phosphate alpha-N-acetylglucosaminyl 1-phosphate transferase [Candidatus Magasanikbacteria bacterium]|nr:undecaprenyl/decaprenyl-phosphate alpha-N-acetylglucosaminyl 1-phosphate transferase [Candidatus Magasanikbacteria bacterium]